jgi:phosphatidylglycerol:prolipoprotein diacylglycerol transferase
LTFAVGRGASTLAPRVRPVLFDIGGFPIHTFGVMLGLGFLFGLWSAGRRARAIGLPQESMMDLGPWLLIGALLGARVLYVATHWSEFSGQGPGEVFKVWRGGLVFYGGLVGSVTAAIIRIRMLKLPLWASGDCLAPGVALGHGIGRLGCFFNGCCYGHPTDVPWAIHYPLEHFTKGVGIHPAQLYETALDLLLAGALAWWFPRRRFNGEVFALYLIAYAFVRSFVELFRGDYPVQSAPMDGVFTPGQSASVVILGAGLLLYAVLRARRSGPTVFTAVVQPKS